MFLSALLMAELQCGPTLAPAGSRAVPPREMYGISAGEAAGDDLHTVVPPRLPR